MGTFPDGPFDDAPEPEEIDYDAEADDLSEVPTPLELLGLIQKLTVNQGIVTKILDVIVPEFEQVKDDTELLLVSTAAIARVVGIEAVTASISDLGLE